MEQRTPATVARNSGSGQADATDLSSRIAKGELSAADATEAALARIEAVNPALNAVVQRMDDEARTAAAAADRAVAAGREPGPLHGVPITVKINIDQKGQATDNGTVLARDTIATEDNPVVANLRRAGAIVVGRTNAPVYSMRWFTDNTLHGPTFNPWSRDHTVGGSSGGAAASVASGMVPLAHGNDIGGSVRYPAACNGLSGLRPSYGRVPSFNGTAAKGSGPGSVASQLMAVQGPIGLSVRDVELGFTAMAVPSLDDPRTMPFVITPKETPRRAAVVPESAWPFCHDDVARAVFEAGERLSRAGWDVVEATPPNLTELYRMWGAIVVPELIATLEPVLDRSGDENIVTSVGFWKQAFGQVSMADTIAAIARRHGILREWLHLLEEFPVLLMPVSLMPAFPRLADVQSAEMTSHIMQAQSPMLVISVLGLPGLCVPVTMSKTGASGEPAQLPLGVQVVAAPWREDMCFAAGADIEAAQPLFCPIDPK
ncbi:amidase [Salipiger thiooxidans]|uniref:amidase n=1 Tax=Salipiger thiooxidans TaxID=282683 RepID=UPI001CD619E5|nr:amidase [Salipiger thiooxidans]MCA0851066.1 amidase [Salipiger thiooxidans]